MNYTYYRSYVIILLIYWSETLPKKERKRERDQTNSNLTSDVKFQHAEAEVYALSLHKLNKPETLMPCKKKNKKLIFE